jgi:hypothetical protein
LLQLTQKKKTHTLKSNEHFNNDSNKHKQRSANTVVASSSSYFNIFISTSQTTLPTTPETILQRPVALETVLQRPVALEPVVFQTVVFQTVVFQTVVFQTVVFQTV